MILCKTPSPPSALNMIRPTIFWCSSSSSSHAASCTTAASRSPILGGPTLFYKPTNFVARLFRLWLYFPHLPRHCFPSFAASFTSDYSVRLACVLLFRCRLYPLNHDQVLAQQSSPHFEVVFSRTLTTFLFFFFTAPASLPFICARATTISGVCCTLCTLKCHLLLLTNHEADGALTANTTSRRHGPTNLRRGHGVSTANRRTKAGCHTSHALLPLDQKLNTQNFV